MSKERSCSDELDIFAILLEYLNESNASSFLLIFPVTLENEHSSVMS